MIHSPGSPAGVPKILAQSAVPVILLPAGVWNNTTGQLAVGTALPYLPAGIVWVYLFASGIAAAGLYQATFTGSAASPVAQIVGNPATVAGAYTPTTNVEVTLATVTVPGGAMGANGAIRNTILLGYSNSANVKTLRYYFGGVNMAGPTRTTAYSDYWYFSITNRGVGGAQVRPSLSTPAFGIGTSHLQSSVDTTVDQTVRVSAQIQSGATTDYVILDGYTIELLPA